MLSENLVTMLDAYKAQHVKLSSSSSEQLEKKMDEQQKAECFYKFLFEERKTKKGEFAYELADKISQDQPFTMPQYIRDAFDHLIPNEEWKCKT